MDQFLSSLRDLPIALEDPVSMALTHSEQQKAQAIKEAVEESPDCNIAALSDLEYVQWALVHPETPVEALCFDIERMQAFKREYKIQDTLEDAMECFKAIAATEEQGGADSAHCRTLQYSPKQGHCMTYSWGGSNSNAKTIMSPKQQALYLKAQYYSLQAMNPTIFASRIGTVHVVHCDEVSGDEDDGIKEGFLDFLFHQLFFFYPNNYRHILFLNPDTAVHLACALWKRDMPKNMKNALTFMGCDTPPPKAGPDTARNCKESFLNNTRQLLQIRYRHQADYVLPPPQEPNQSNGIPCRRGSQDTRELSTRNNNVVG